MTDKQIIIDGVDVADCEHINACDKKMKCVILQDDVCETNPYCEGFNCYYKQLKRSEAQCEGMFISHTDLEKKYKAKEQECEELKELVKKQKDVLIHKTILADEYEKAYSFENLKVAKLKYCLAEIKELCKRQDLNQGSRCIQILQKIREVEDGSNN